jgi:hypothetical protein
VTVRNRRTEDTWRGDSCADGLDAYRRLAARVIAQALRDLVTSGPATSDGESARRFLAGSPMLSHWCQLAEIDVTGVRTRVRSLESQLVRARLARLEPRV